MEDKINVAIEQLRDVYCGRSSYTSNAEWLDNLDTCMQELCTLVGLDFKPMANEAD